jgi:hypothetical protein
VSGGGHARLVNGILCLLCRQHFLGLVEYAWKTEPAYTFDHYAVAPDVGCANKAAQVKQELWVSLSRTTLLNTSHSLNFS